MATLIQIAYEVPDETVTRIETMLHDTALRDINWNGAEFKVERDDFTCIPNDESANAIRLLDHINQIIEESCEDDHHSGLRI